MTKEATTQQPKDCKQKELYTRPPGDADREVTPILTSESGNFEVNAVNRYNDEINDWERTYEIFNCDTGVVEARTVGSVVTAKNTMDLLDKMYSDLKAGSDTLKYSPTISMVMDHMDKKESEVPLPDFDDVSTH